jgi:hypothetical protein
MARTIGEATIEYIHELLKHFFFQLLCDDFKEKWMISINKRIICSIRRNKRDKKVSTPTAGAFTIWKCANVAGGSGKQEILVVMPWE